MDAIVHGLYLDPRVYHDVDSEAEACRRWHDEFHPQFGIRSATMKVELVERGDPRAQGIPQGGRPARASNGHSHTAATDGAGTGSTVMITCPNMGTAIPTGIAMDQASFDTSALTNNTVSCPACGQSHTWSKADAFLA